MIITRLPLKHPVTRALFAGLFAVSLTACAPSIAGADLDTDTHTNTHADNQNDVTIDGEVRTLTIDADVAKENRYHYFSFAQGQEVTIETPEDSLDWDIAFMALNPKVNGGIHGKGGVSVVRLADQDFDALEQAPAEGYLTDVMTEKQVALAFRQNGGWAAYDMTTHTVTLPSAVFVVKTSAGKYMKVQFLGYRDDAGTDRMVTFKWAEIEAPEEN